jgi:hypothetical protein
MNRWLQMFLFSLLLVISCGCAVQPASQPEATGTQAPGPEATAEEELLPDTASSGDAALAWEGDPDLGDNQADCLSLRLTASGEATIGPCGEAGTPAELLAQQQQTWTGMLNRFAPFEYESEQERVVFEGQGDIASPAWERAIASWARFTYMQAASGRVSASVQTVMSWWLGETPGQPGYCRHLVVLNYGYAYANIDPCEGGQTAESVAGWLETSEWEPFDAWLYDRAPVYEGDNYFAGLGTTEMSEAEVESLSEWAEGVYTRLAPSSPGETAATSSGACPEPAAGTQLLENEEHGYCLLYPTGYQVEQPNEDETILVVGSLMNVEDPRVHIEVSEAGDRTAEEAADQVEADYAVPGLEVERSSATVGGEEAIVLDNLSGQDINRRVVFVHAGRLYDLMFAPASEDAGQVYQRMEELYDMVINSFTFLTQ